MSDIWVISLFYVKDNIRWHNSNTYFLVTQITQLHGFYIEGHKVKVIVFVKYTEVSSTFKVFYI